MKTKISVFFASLTVVLFSCSAFAETESSAPKVEIKPSECSSVTKVYNQKIKKVVTNPDFIASEEYKLATDLYASCSKALFSEESQREKFDSAVKDMCELLSKTTGEQHRCRLHLMEVATKRKQN